MINPNERRTRAGYELFLASDPDVPSHWDFDSPLAATLDDDVVWFDDEENVDPALVQVAPILRDPTRRGKQEVLDRLKELRGEMISCQILSSSEFTLEAGANPGDPPTRSIVHTIDHAVKKDENAAYERTRPHLCASSFIFNERGKVTTVRYCSRQLPLQLFPAPPEPSA